EHYGGEVILLRLAVTPEQGNGYDLPGEPAKPSNVQAEAIPPATMVGILRRAIEQLPRQHGGASGPRPRGGEAVPCTRDARPGDVERPPSLAASGVVPGSTTTWREPTPARTRAPGRRSSRPRSSRPTRRPARRYHRR